MNTPTLAECLEQAKTGPADLGQAGLAMLREELARTDAGIAGWERYLSGHPGNVIAERQLAWEQRYRRRIVRDLDRLERGAHATDVWERFARGYETP